MSTLQVENLQGPTTGANANTITVASGHTFIPSSGQVLQIASGYNDTQYASSTTGSWNTTFTFSINNVRSGSSCLIEVDPAGLMESNGGVVYGVFDGSTELGRCMHNTSGNGGWRTAPTMITCTDTSPSVGTNTYTLKIWSTGPYWYINYVYPSGYKPRTSYKITELAG